MSLASRRARNKPTKAITLENGWNPNFEPGTKVVARKAMWTITAHQVFEYQGGCDHPEYGWAIHLKDCNLTIPGYLFEDGFLQIL